MDGDVASARLYATAHGIYVAEINGRRVGDDALAPGWTSYHRRLRYQTYDVTGLLRPGANAIGFQVADGWWRGRLGFVPGAGTPTARRSGCSPSLRSPAPTAAGR